jgi:hypothetical protein
MLAVCDRLAALKHNNLEVRAGMALPACRQGAHSRISPPPDRARGLVGELAKAA